jgi:hypothetical protein
MVDATGVALTCTFRELRVIVCPCSVREGEKSAMDPHSSRLQPDGTTFPPVTPDPPPPPGYVDPLEELERALGQGRGTRAEPDPEPDPQPDAASDRERDSDPGSAGTQQDEDSEG